jgi:hypothetical protein
MAKHGKKFVVKIRWGDKATRAEVYDDPESCAEYSFDTKKEREAFMLGAGEALGWTDYDYVDETTTKWEEED